MKDEKEGCLSDLEKSNGKFGWLSLAGFGIDLWEAYRVFELSTTQIPVCEMGGFGLSTEDLVGILIVYQHSWRRSLEFT